MKVGSVPVVRAFSRCKVVVGGSAMNGRRKAFAGWCTDVSYSTDKALWKWKVSAPCAGVKGTVKS